MDNWKLRMALQKGKLQADGLYDVGEDIAEKFDRSGLNAQRVQHMLATAQNFYDRLLREIRPLVATG